MNEPQHKRDEISTVGDLLKYLRIRAQLSQRELAIATGYSESQISRLERGLRNPAREALQALFVPALGLEDEPDMVARLLAAADHRVPAPLTPHGVLSETRRNLPAQLTSFIGRMVQVEKVVEHVKAERLVTVTGTGGVGKTRLALRAAEVLLDHFRGRVWLVELARLSEPRLVARAVAEALEIRQQPGQDLAQTLVLTLRLARGLIVLDNCEHLVEAVAELADQLLRGCPELHILATSREMLGVAGEMTYYCPSLSLPEGAEMKHIAVSEAVQLFCERARAVSSSFTLNKENAGVVNQVCQRLDGIPLAIELAAARIRMLTVEQIAGRLDDVFQLLTVGNRAGLPRHRTLHACIEWSYGLLTEEEQMLLSRLSVFAGGWTLEAAEQVCADIDNGGSCGGLAGGGAVGWSPERQERIPVLRRERILTVLGGLVDKSLVQFEPAAAGEPRYRLLETVRQYAFRRNIEREEVNQLRSSHLDYFLNLSQEAAPHLRAQGARTWLDRLECEMFNIRQALSWSQEGEVEKGLRLATALLILWECRGRYFEGVDWFERLLHLQEDRRARQKLETADLAARGRALNGLSMLITRLRNETLAVRPDPSTTIEDHESQSIFERLGEAYRLDLEIARYNEASNTNNREALLACRQQFIQLHEPRWIAECDLKLIFRFPPDDDRAFIYGEEGLALRREIGDMYGEGLTLRNLSYYETYRGNLELAQQLLAQSVACLEAAGDRVVAEATRAMMPFAWSIDREDFTEAFRIVEQLHSAAIDLNKQELFVLSMYLEAELAFNMGEYERTTRLCQEGIRLGEDFPDERNIYAYWVLARTAYFQEEFSKFYMYIRLILQFEQLSKRISWYSPASIKCIGMAMAREGQPRLAARLWGAWKAHGWWLLTTVSPPVNRKYQELLASVRVNLGEKAFTEEWETGRTMSIEQAQNLVLSLCIERIGIEK